MPMERRPFGRDWGLSLRMTLCLVLLAGLYLPFLLWILGFAYFFWGASGVFLGTLVALGLLALSPYLSERLALSTARVQWDHEAIDARLRPMVERLCALADLPTPRVAAWWS
jgi:heat shock protein HtpX